MKLCNKEIKKISAKCGFTLDPTSIYEMPIIGVHHVHEWDHGYESNYGYNGKRREFYSDMHEMLLFLKDYLSLIEAKEFIVSPFNRYNQFDVIDTQNDIYVEIRKFLNHHEIGYHTISGVNLTINDNWEVIEMLVEGAFRGISDLCMLFPNQNLLLEPNHHFDLPFFTKAFKQNKNVVCKIINQYPNLKYYEKNIVT